MKRLIKLAKGFRKSELNYFIIDNNIAIIGDKNRLLRIPLSIDDNSNIENGSYHLPTLIKEETLKSFKISDDNYNKMLNFHQKGVKSDDLVSIQDIKQFQKMFKFTSTDDLRKNITGVYLDKDEAKLVATDAHKLIIIEDNNLKGLKESVIIPNSFERQIRELKPTSIQVDNQTSYLWIDDVAICFDKVADRFPVYSNLVPNRECVTLKVDRREFTKAIREASKNTNYSIKLALNKELDTVKVFAEDKDYKLEYNKTIPAHVGDNFEIRFQAKNLVLCVNNLTNNEIEFKFYGGASIALIDDKIYLMPTMW